MDFEARLKAVANLARSDSEAASHALEREVEAASSTLATAADYDALDQSLAILNAIGFRSSRAAAGALAKFVESVNLRDLVYSDQDLLFGGAYLKYRNHAALIVKAISALSRLRYRETGIVLHTLLRLSSHSAASVQKKAMEGLKELAEYDINVFYGVDRRGGIGSQPQKVILDEVQALTDDAIAALFPAAIALLNGVLSPTMEGTSWSYRALTVSQSATPAIPSVSEVRTRAIDQLIRIYGLVTTNDRKLAVIGSLTGATRTESRAPRNDESSQMFVRNAQTVLTFFSQVVEKDALEIVQKIEHNTYWIFVHAISDEIEHAALLVRDRIAQRSEYRFYRILIGFEGIFGDWNRLREKREEWKDREAYRRKIAREYAESISDSNYDKWRLRILNYSQIRSNDLATFPVFYYFLETFAVANPKLALRILSEDTQALSGFLIPLLRGLRGGAYRNEVRMVVESWVGKAQNLFPSMRQFQSSADFDLAFVKTILSKADEVNDVATIREAVSVAVSNYTSDARGLIDALMLPAIGMLTKRSNSDWIFDNWYRPEITLVLAACEPYAIDEILRNLVHVQKLDYHAEEVLYILAQKAPEKVLAYLCERMMRKVVRTGDTDDMFDAIPFEFHKLNEPLAKIPALAVRTLLESYDGRYSNFLYGGARLLRNIFPEVSGEFEAELLELVHEGGERHYEFVLAILRNYHGELFVHNLCKEIIKKIPIDSPLRTEVAIALETTGVVSGEFGMANAYERKREEVSNWLQDPDSRVQEFAKWYIEDLEKMRDAESKRAAEDIALQKFRYGEE